MIKSIRRTGDDPFVYFSNAKTQVRPTITHGVTKAMRVTAAVASSIAPKYNRSRWLKYTKYAHHIQSGKGGKLKRSITAGKVRNIGRKWATSLYSKVKYSSYQEGGFRHKGAGRYIRGKFYMLNAIHQLDTKFMGWQLKKELDDMFRRLG